MKKKWIAILLIFTLVLGVLGASAIAVEDGAEQTDTETVAAAETPAVGEAAESAPSENADEQTENSDPAEEPEQNAETVESGEGSEDPAGEETGESEEEETEKTVPADDQPIWWTLGFADIESRILQNNYTALSLSENIAMLKEIDYKKLENDLRNALYEIEDAQWMLTSNSGAAQMQQLTQALDMITATSQDPKDLVYAGAIKGLQTGLTMLQKSITESTNATLQAQYDALNEQLGNIKNGKLQKDNEGIIFQLETAQQQMVAAAETLYITLIGLESSNAALDRSLAALDRTVTEMELRYKLGQISQLQLRQITSGREQLVSGQTTLQMNINLLRMQLNVLLGEDSGSVLTLQPISGVSAEQLSSMSLDADLTHSKEVSYEIYSAAKTLADANETYNDAVKKYGANSTKMEFTQAKHTWQAAQYTYQASIQNYELKFRTAYAKVGDAAQILNAAQSALTLEETELQVAQLKYQLGTISANALKTAEDELQDAKDSVSTAARDLFSAYNTYQWAVKKGILN